MNRYSSIKKEKLGTDDIRSSGTNVFSKTPTYPEIPLNSDDIYILTDAGDNLPELSNKFYNNITLYWIIATANPDVLSFGSIFPTPGTQLRIPVNISSIIDKYNQINSL